MNSQAQSIIKNHTLYAVAAGLIPIPLVDLAAVTAIQIDMAKQLAKTYHIPWSDNSGKTIIGALVGGLGARIGANIIKLIPGIGTVIGGIAMSITSGASTYAVGKVLESHFEKGQTLEDLNPDDYQDEYKDAFNEGKEYAKKVKQEQEGNLKKVAELGKLRQEGVITEEEFQIMKKRLLNID